MTLEISRPWARAATGAEERGGGFLTIENKGNVADRLVAVSTPAAETVEIHAIRVVGPGTKMQPLEAGLAVPPRTTIILRPRGYHLLMKGFKAPLVAGTRISAVLTFEKAGPRNIEMVVEAPGPVGEDALHEKP